MNERRTQRIFLIALTLVIVTFGTVVAHESDSEHEHVDPHEMWKFTTISEAQAIVPFDIKLPDPGSGYAVEGANVARVTTADSKGEVVQIEIFLRTPDGSLVLLKEGDGPVTPWGTGESDDGVTSKEELDVNGVSGLAITGTNTEGKVIGAIYWITEGVTYRVVQAGVRGPELIGVAESIR